MTRPSHPSPANAPILTLAIMVLHAILVLPSEPADLTPARLAFPTWELPAILLVLVLLPGPALRSVVVGLATALLVLRAADLGTNLAFSRPFNPLLDLHLLRSGWSLLASSIGYGQAIAAIGAAFAAVGLAAFILWTGLAHLLRLGPRIKGTAIAVTLALALVAALVPGWRTLAVTPAVAAQISDLSTGMADLAAFTADLDAAPQSQPRFAALAGRDVILAFVESYGRTFLDDPTYARIALPRLDHVAARLDAAGWHARSGWIAAPTRGGQSWLSHGTFLSGLKVDSQVRYDRLMTSRRTSLNALFGAAGWHVAAAMPAITRDWPEAAWYGYDVTLDAAAMDYAGAPFEWVTMPDQYTWTALDRRLRGDDPAMIEVALITSHAPWTPLPRILPWDRIGDGAVFDGTHRDGDTPRAVWSNKDSIRAQYAKSLDYALEVMAQYIARDGRGALFVVLGDHQPAPLLTGPGAPPDVPIHIIADDPRLLDRLPGDVFQPGMLPGADSAVLPMQDMRAILTTIFETPL